MKKLKCKVHWFAFHTAPRLYPELEASDQILYDCQPNPDDTYALYLNGELKCPRVLKQDLKFIQVPNV